MLVSRFQVGVGLFRLNEILKRSISNVNITSKYEYPDELGTEYTPPDLSQVTKQWNTKTMSPLLKEEIKEYLVWKMEDDWKTMTNDETKAAYYLSFGSWGPRGKGGSEGSDPIFILLKSTYSLLIFAGLGVSLVNFKRDKSLLKDLETLK
ncbi:hypothetical protein Kpol_460p2 [Vanderwaltozyma polyspora DSM 70294]|uniref:Uncharacterized protein n=1 Tax=Vanderwaltozyma polyspora (strain ATCC 22028 / DSM 70294 / BCRC 21397 / CBS 2163 / NBRC 10782 / NRRL Y-8283 / UCD 57-17) TaxID=436907 RepID=A7TQR8_VANPO|nr:uncharacterized protein Kpol_460p2 [Vanderwaltozyma polyspora DSM 70294]EDO15367.1 hypothetical protein Kpol_460p2 [Vanderwaltozyma polyspora DSM 70294]